MPWPEVSGASASYLAFLGPDGPRATGTDGAEPRALDLPDGPAWLGFLERPLADWALEPGPFPLGSARPLPPTIALYRRDPERWVRVAGNDPDLAGVRLADPRGDLCERAHGCRGYEPNPEFCQVPCPCPSEPLATAAYPRLPCPLPAPRGGDQCFTEEGLVPGLVDAAAPNPNAVDRVTSFVREGGAVSVYLSTDRFGPPGVGVVAKGRWDPSGGVVPGSVVPVELGLPVGTRSERPYVRADGLELWFQSDLPNPTRSDGIYLSARMTPELPFAPARPVTIANAPPSRFSTNPSRYPILLGDYRTLLYRSEEAGVSTLVRTSSQAGANEWDGVQAFPFAPGEGAISLAVGCDRQTILYLATLGGDYRVIFAPIQTLAPISLYSARELRTVEGVPLRYDTDEGALVETPDCAWLWWSGGQGVRRYRRVPCP